MDELTRRASLWDRILRATGLVKVDPKTGKVDHKAGAEFVADVGYRSTYDPKKALSAFAAFPWPYACTEAISADLASLPIRVYRGRGADAEILDDHPVLDLFQRPSMRVDSGLWRRQLYTDLVLTGNAFQLLATGPGGAVTSLLRLHPARVTIAPMEDGQVSHYRYEGGGGHPADYEHDQVVHFRGPSWTDDPSNLWGTGSVQPLHHDLTTEKAQAELTARQAVTGQPSGLLTPSDEMTTWSKAQVADLRRLYESQMQSGGSGVLILGGQANFEKMAWSPRDLEWSSVRDFVRQSTLAAFGVVPVRVGIESQNFATAQSQMRLYWGSLQGRAAIIDAGLSRIAQRFDPDLYIRHDFSAVDVLQESRTERLGRVQTWAAMGVPLSEAAAYEGFDDLPFTPEDDREAEQPTPDDVEAPEADTDTDTPETTEEPLAATALNGAQIASLLTVLAQVAAGAITFDAAMALIGVSFPTIPEDEAARILQGAQAIGDEDEVEPEALTLAAYESIDFSPPEGVRDELRRGLEWHEQGHSGDGLTPSTVTWARRMANGEDISPEKAIKMRAWLARHESDKQGEGFSPGEDGFPSPGRVAWALWGGDPAVSWSEKLVGQMEREDEESKGTGQALRSLVDGIQHKAATEPGAAWLVRDNSEQGSAIWRQFENEIRGSTEKALRRVFRGYLTGHAARIASRVPRVLAEKAVGDGSVVFRIEGDWLGDLVNELEEGRILEDDVREALTKSYQDAMEYAYNSMESDMVPDFAYDPAQIDPLVDKHLGELIKDVPGGSRQAVRSIVTNGIAEGSTISEIQAAIMASTSISSPMRARRIARTEATKSVNAGGVAAWERQASEAGVSVDFYWDAAPDAREKPYGGHRVLDGVKRGEDGRWKLGSNSTVAPGQWTGPNDAALNINCRCTFRPKVNR